MIGQTLSHFEITAKLGEGGMGEVYRATDTTLDREVAIKVLPEAMTADPERLARFEREAKVLASLNHPNIAGIHSIEEVEGQRLLVMELVEGEDLTERMERGAVAMEDAVAIAVQVAQGLEGAHERGIVHRDLKPANIKLMSDGQAKILDFGLAKAHEASAESSPDATRSPTLTAQMTQAGVILGTAAYMSPEQARGQEAGPRSDIWSLGVVLYEMLTGARLFAEPTVSDTLAAVLRADFDWASLPEETPRALRRVLRRCLERDPKRRYHAAADLRIDLEEALSGASEETAAAAGAAPEAGLAGWRLAVGALAALALGALGAVLTTGAFDRAGDSSAAAPIGVRRGAMFVQAGLHRGIARPGIALSPDGRLLAYLAGEDELELALWVRRLDQLEATKLVDDARSVSFSPDGNWLLFRDDSNRLQKVPVGGGAPQALVENVGLMKGQSWGPEGRIVYAPNWGHDGLFSVSASGGEPRRLTTPENQGTHEMPSHVPGGEGLIFSMATAAGRQSLAYLDLESLETSVLRENAHSGRLLPTGHMLWVTDGTLYAATFDSSRRALVGAAVPVVGDVLSLYGVAAYSTAENGTLAYLQSSRDNTSSIGWADSREALVEGRNFASPALSPDGTRLAYSVHDEAGGAAIWLLDLAGGVPTRLSVQGAAAYAYAPRWSADGDQIYYDLLPEGDESHVRNLRVAADGSSAPADVAGAEGYWVTAVDPNGRFLVVQPHGTVDQLVLPLTEGAAAEPLAVSPATEFWPAVSPDSRWIAYVSNEAGTLSVFVRAWPDTGGVRQIPYPGSAGHPRWSADGRTLYFRVSGGIAAVPVNVQGDSLSFGASTRVAAVASGTWLGRQVGRRELLRDYDVGPDGRLIVVRDASLTGDIEAHAVMVYNWFDDFARRVAEGQ